MYLQRFVSTTHLPSDWRHENTLSFVVIDSPQSSLMEAMADRLDAAAATDNDPDRPVLFFCQINCWMSWNAGKRAMETLGYTHVLWFPDGLDGWAFEELPVESIQPWAP